MQLMRGSSPIVMLSKPRIEVTRMKRTKTGIITHSIMAVAARVNLFFAAKPTKRNDEA